MYCKGSYFRVSASKARFINHLVYRVPPKHTRTLGIYATLDLGGGLRLGPDEEYIEDTDYQVKETKNLAFFESVKKFLPFIELEDLTADIAGIRPKLKDYDDFIIREESNKSLGGLINLLGIESPGFTSSLF
ncbi:MAG: FAD-dependent oxidoreductase [Candidatus Omnitrophica bacterium]|nr:FAD-dependent oxidoreductase [Candidatus Omnitrophota bacterium]